MAYYNSFETSSVINYNRTYDIPNQHRLDKCAPNFTEKKDNFDYCSDCIKISLIISEKYKIDRYNLMELVKEDFRIQRLQYSSRFNISFYEQTKRNIKKRKLYQCIDIDINFRYHLHDESNTSYNINCIIGSLLTSICSEKTRKSLLLNCHNLLKVIIQYRSMNRRVFSYNVFKLIKFDSNIVTANTPFKELYVCKLLNDEYPNISLNECSMFITKQSIFKNINLRNSEINYIQKELSFEDVTLIDCIETLITPVMKFYIDKVWGKKRNDQSFNDFVVSDFSEERIKQFARELYDYRRDFCVQFYILCKKLTVNSYNNYEDLMLLLIKTIVIAYENNDKKIFSIYEIKNKFHKECDKLFFDNELFNNNDVLTDEEPDLPF